MPMMERRCYQGDAFDLIAILPPPVPLHTFNNGISFGQLIIDAEYAVPASLLAGLLAYAAAARCANSYKNAASFLPEPCVDDADTAVDFSRPLASFLLATTAFRRHVVKLIF